MEERMIFAGSGGQGLMTLGKLAALVGMREGRNVTWYPSYGAEVRGGTAHCHVVIKDGEVFSPLVEEASSLVVMNEPSLVRFGGRLADGGVMVLNTSLAEAPKEVKGRVVEVKATDIANDLGNIRVANMAMLGALNAATGLFGEETLLGALEEFLGERGRGKGMMDINLKAYRLGAGT